MAALLSLSNKVIRFIFCVNISTKVEYKVGSLLNKIKTLLSEF